MTGPNNSHRWRVLVADDQPDVREALRLLLKAEGFEIDAVASPTALVASLDTREFDAVLMDLNYARDTTSGQEGLDLLTEIRSRDSSLPVIVMTAWGSLNLAVEAMRRGAKDFIQKPWENARLLAILRTQIELAHAIRQSVRLEAENRLLRADGRPMFIAESAVMRPVLDLISRVGPSDANVLITGEHGTGKEVVARTLQALSTRSGKPFVTVNAGGLPEGVFESELFGHVKGAFTDAKTDRVGRFELADGGTLFLDEIANVPLNLQASSSARSKPANSNAWAHQARGAWMCAFSPPPTRISKSKWKPDGSARICFSASTPSKFISRRYANARKTFRCWRCIFCGNPLSATART
jgi:DNA-binding NtrC family response regulator